MAVWYQMALHCYNSQGSDVFAVSQVPVILRPVVQSDSIRIALVLMPVSLSSVWSVHAETNAEGRDKQSQYRPEMLSSLDISRLWYDCMSLPSALTLQA